MNDLDTTMQQSHGYAFEIDHEYCGRYYKDVKTWDDLVETNIAFLEGRQPCTFYYGNTFKDDAYLDDTHRMEDDLLRLHREFGIFTYNGHSSMLEDRHRQRGFIEFVCEKSYTLAERLLSDQRIYAFVREENPDGTSSILHNCPESINLTEPRGSSFNLAIWEESNELLGVSEGLDGVHALLQDAMYVFVCTREFPSHHGRHQEVTRCVLDALEGRN